VCHVIGQSSPLSGDPAELSFQLAFLISFFGHILNVVRVCFRLGGSLQTAANISEESSQPPIDSLLSPTHPPPPRKFQKCLTKPSRISCTVENTGYTHLKIERNPWPGGYRPQIPVLSAFCPQLNLLTPPPTPPKKKEKIPGNATAAILSFCVLLKLVFIWHVPSHCVCVCVCAIKIN
jgi:hypothetical protein